MEIRQSFHIDQPPAVVWRSLCDVPLVAQCLPGAELTESLGDDRHKGRVTVKLGPLTAAFSGEVGVTRDAAAQTGTVVGKGTDGKSGSRAQATMTYALVAEDGPRTRVDIVSDIALTGALAQFGRAAIVNDVAARLTDAFARSLQERLAAAPPPASPAPAPSPPPLDMNRLILRVVWQRVVEVFRRLFHPSTAA